MRYLIFILLFQSGICMALQPISEYCEDSYLLGRIGGDIFTAKKCLVYGYTAEDMTFFKNRNTSIEFDDIKPSIEKFINIVNSEVDSFLDKQKAFDEYTGVIDSFSVPLFGSYDEFEDAKASLVFSINYTTHCNISVLDYSGGDKFMIGYKLNRMTDEGKYNYDYLYIELPKEAKINKADSDGLIDAFCHNDLSFKNKE